MKSENDYMKCILEQMKSESYYVEIKKEILKIEKGKVQRVIIMLGKKIIDNNNFYLCNMLSEQQINIIIDAMKLYNPTKIGIFGSVAHGENTMESDIDILYEFDSKYSLFDLGGLSIMLEKALGQAVDLVEMNHIHPFLKDRVLSDVKMIYGR